MLNSIQRQIQPLNPISRIQWLNSIQRQIQPLNLFQDSIVEIFQFERQIQPLNPK